MLYQNDKVETKVYDPETGEDISLLPDNPGEKDEVQETIRKSGEFQKLQRMEAWGDLKDWIDWQINNYKEILVNEADTDKIRRLQEAVKSFRSVLSFVTIKGLEGDLLQQQMQNQDPLTGLIQGDNNE